MSLEELIVIIVRISGSFPVLYFPFFGSLFAILVDLSDLFIIGNLDLGGVKNYQRLDKLLDLSYMLTFLIVSLRWSKLEKNISIFLLIFRMLGMIFYEITGSRMILFSFPNIFEFWFIGISFYKFRNKIINIKSITLILVIATILKLLQEWILHWNKYLDNYAMGDILSVIKDIFTFL
tara:strand:- start:1797 stop:2330 length:534 start_codon:yes stop_codon:yes gene_type:complete